MTLSPPSNQSDGMTLSPPSDDPRLDTIVRLGIATGTISVIGSVMIILILLRSPKKLKSVYRRLVFGLSCFDIVHSLTYVAGALLVPNDEETWHSTFAIGNVITCNIQGFMKYIGLMGSLFYSCMLSIYFTLVIVYSKNEEAIQKSIEPFFHALSTLVPIGSGIYLMATNHFNGAGFTCWITAYPSDCKWKENVKCTRGNYAMRYQVYFVYIPLALVSCAFFACMIHLLRSITTQDKKMSKYGSNEILANIKKKRQSAQSTSTINAKIAHRSSIRNRSSITHRSSIVKKGSSNKSRNEMKQTSIQAILYISSMILALIFPSFLITRKDQSYSNKKIIWELQCFFLPLLGFYNFFIFIRPRVIITMKAKPDLSFLRAFIVAIISKEVRSPQGRRSVRSSMRNSVTRRSLLRANLAIDAKNVAIQIQEEEDEEKGEIGKGEKDSNNNDENEESKEEILAHQGSLCGRENNTPSTKISLNHSSIEGEEKERKEQEHENCNDNYDDKIESDETKEEVTYHSMLHARESNTALTNIGLNQSSNNSSASYSDGENSKGANVGNVDLTDDYNNML